MREGALIGEADIECDIGERRARVGEQRERRVEPQPMQIAMRRLAERLIEELIKATHAETAMHDEIGDAQRLG